APAQLLAVQLALVLLRRAEDPLRLLARHLPGWPRPLAPVVAGIRIGLRGRPRAAAALRGVRVVALLLLLPAARLRVAALLLLLLLFLAQRQLEVPLRLAIPRLEAQRLLVRRDRALEQRAAG